MLVRMLKEKCRRGHKDWFFWEDKKSGVTRRYCRTCRNMNRIKYRAQIKK